MARSSLAGFRAKALTTIDLLEARNRGWLPSPERRRMSKRLRSILAATPWLLGTLPSLVMLIYLRRGSRQTWATCRAEWPIAFRTRFRRTASSWLGLAAPLPAMRPFAGQPEAGFKGSATFP